MSARCMFLLLYLAVGPKYWQKYKKLLSSLKFPIGRLEAKLSAAFD
jgi:hypothetical protein